MFRTVLVPLDRSALAEQALGRAAAIARASRATLDVAMVHHPAPLAALGRDGRDVTRWQTEHAYLEAIVEELRTGASIAATNALLTGEVVERLSARAHDVGADLVVMTSRGRTGLGRDWFGSVADGMIRRSAIPVLMLRPVDGPAGRAAAHRLFRHVVVAHDGSAYAGEVLEPALALAACCGARVTVLRVVQPAPLFGLELGLSIAVPPPSHDQARTREAVDEARGQLADAVRGLPVPAGVEVTPQVVLGEEVARTLTWYAATHGGDLVALTTHGRGASRLVIGSVTDRLLREGRAPLLVHRPSPATAVRPEGTMLTAPASRTGIAWARA